MLCVCLVLTHGFTTAHRVSLINLQTYHCIPCMNKIPLTKENFISDQLQTFFILTAKKFINYMWQRSRRYCVRRAKQTQNYWGCLKRLILSLFIPWVEADWAFIYVLIIELGPKFLPLSYWSDASNNLSRKNLYKKPYPTDVRWVMHLLQFCFKQIKSKSPHPYIIVWPEILI